MRKRKRKRYFKKRLIVIILFLLIVGTVITYNSFKPLPEGTSFEGAIHQVEDVEFLYDLSYKTKSGEIKREQQIFDTINKAIDEAESFIVLDMFLFNGFYDEEMNFPKLSSTLTNRIIERKKANPELEVIFITDEVNTTYNSYTLKELDKLQRNGVEIIITNLDRLRDPNPLYSGVYRTFLQWTGEKGPGWVPNPMAKSAPKVTIRSYLRLLNVKANHRKMLATEKTAIVTSANPHDASGFHSNIAFQLEGNIIADFVKAEEAVSRFSDGQKDFPVYPTTKREEGPIQVQLLTEGKVNTHVLKEIESTKEGETIWLGMFYIADRQVVSALTEAARRGVKIKMVLDPNQNAFGSEKIGLPNLPVAAEFNKLGEKNIEIRWYNTDKEQFHTKLIFIEKQDSAIMIGGSTNYTSRNLDDYNLESAVKIISPSEEEITQEVKSYFTRLWENEGGIYTVDYDEYQDDIPAFKYIMYRIQKVLRFTTY